MSSLEEQIKEIAERVKKDSEMKLSLSELFDDEFISKNTKFKSYKELISASGINIDNGDDFEHKKDSGVFDSFINQNTQFDTMDEMEKAAAKEKLIKGLKDKGYTLG